MSVKSPILFLIFNRPELTEKVFTAIKQAQPEQLFIAADGPRDGFNEEALCETAREIALAVDWPCTVQTLFQEKNLGCGKAVSNAISWFFDHVEQGIILEDDCLPDPSFFEFCDELLDKYTYQENVMVISGNNFLPDGWKKKKQSYCFAFLGIWGWATWKRAWQLYEYEISGWGNQNNRNEIRKAMGSDYWYNYYLGIFDGVYRKQLDTWDVQWVYCVFKNRGLPITPAINLVKNIGFGETATHTLDTQSAFANLIANEISFPLKHPLKIKIDKQYLKTSYLYISLYGRSFTEVIKLRLREILNLIKSILDKHLE